jgi:Endonuclease/Exonuclease/phosphatase family
VTVVAGGIATFAYAGIDFRAAPATTVTEYELALSKSSRPNGTDRLFQNPAFRLVLRDSGGGDRVPDAGSIEYTLNLGSPPSDSPLAISRGPCDVRFATLNVEFDSIFDPSLQPAFDRLLSAVAPDVLLFQEVYDHSSAQLRDLVAQWISPAPAPAWHAAGNADCHVVSRFPLLQSWPLNGNVAVLLDTTAAAGVPTLLVNAHLPCCNNDAGRRVEIDRILQFLRDALTPGGNVTLPAGAWLVIGGDLNLVGDASQLNSLLSGDVIDEATFGPDFPPDWDGSPLTTVLPRQADRRMGYTWRDDAQTYWPGQLDYLIYADSAMSRGRSFVLYTPDMSAARLAQYGLAADDSLATDHLLFVADFRGAGAGLPADVDGDGDVDLSDLALLLANFGSGPQPPAPAGDTDGDDDVDLADLSTLLSSFGVSC